MSTRSNRRFRRARLASGLCFILVGCSPLGVARPRAQEVTAAKAKVTVVNCDAGERLTRALSRAVAGATIVVQGTCRERVVITKPVTINGGGSAVIDGTGVTPTPGLAPEFDGLVFIDGITNVTLEGLTIQHSAVNGIRAARGSAVLLRNVIARSNAMAGVEITDNSAAEAINVTTQSNSWGFDVLMNSVLVIKGTFTSTDNARNGVVIHQGSMAENRGAQVTVTNNQIFGVVVGNGSQLVHSQWEAARGSTLTVSENGSAGVFLADSSLTTTSDTVITATGNGVGILAVAGSNIANPTGAGTFVLRQNGVGMNLASGSAAILIGGLDVSGNKAGILADEASVHLEAAAGLPASIEANGLDLRLSFGSRSTIQSVSVGTPLVCDRTVLSRGTTTCP